MNVDAVWLNHLTYLNEADSNSVIIENNKIDNQ